MATPFRLENFYENPCLCVTSCFLNSSLIFLRYPYFLFTKGYTLSFSCKNLLKWTHLQGLSHLLYLLRTEVLFCRWVIDQYLTHKIRTTRRLWFKLSDIKKKAKKNLILLEHIPNCHVYISTYLLHFNHDFEQGLKKYFKRKWRWNYLFLDYVVLSFILSFIRCHKYFKKVI